MKRCKVGDLIVILRDDPNPVNVGMLGKVIAVANDLECDWEIEPPEGTLYEVTDENGDVALDNVMLMPDAWMQPIRGAKPKERVQDAAYA